MAAGAVRSFWSRAPGGLFWKVFAACWCSSLFTGVGIHLFARLFPALVQLPPMPPTVAQSAGMPVLVGGFIALGFSGVLAWSLSRPIRLLRQAFGAAAAGQLAQRLAPQLGRQRDEFAELARDYDRMAQQLQTLLGAQSRLLHDVSHELRSPLARLQMATGLLRRNPAAAIPALTLQRIDHEVERLDALVDEVLTLARLESGVAGVPLGAEPEGLDVQALLHSVLDDARFEAQQQGQGRRLTLAAPAEGPLLAAQGELLQRAFDNVLRNALKFSPPGGEVELAVHWQAGDAWWTLWVRDRGPGLSAEDCQRVFEPFVRGVAAPAAGAPAAPGFGLGLAIAQRALQAHGGRIQAQPRDGGGLALCLQLPVPPAHAFTGFNANAGCNPEDAAAGPDHHGAMTMPITAGGPRASPS
ncbi:sensor histidine kinase [Aquabacterium sp. OR-4]|uniref:sensor histidine kinase n=1 Tax=Aquabacterium sp. OR-4 TaxID=2978127 RepID=UPI0021B40EAD|nr:HAMP domain-containing sensor histidine kinase [Aquabacterium sp. OR-4]MDT7836987.1 HAMP domain-containing sensor histidine kinase [Aquabacterium sp. OR-4]